MKVLKLLLAFLICFTMVACGGSDDLPTNTVQLIPTEGFVSPESYPNMTLVWEDDFEGTSLDPANWTYEIGTGQSGWGNNELQYYTAEFYTD